MSGTIENPLTYAAETVGKDPMATFLGITVEEVQHGYARCALVVKPEYCNAVDRAHGTTVYAVADQALAVAANATGTMAFALNVNINFVAAAASGETIVAEASAVSMGRKISVWKIAVTGKNKAVVASGEGVAYHK
ncbi:MAG: PaaI family thioesterase [Desulfobacterales bacterium]|nr:PaaI family thioesterase [Desulfobacterales bacterium]